MSPSLNPSQLPLSQCLENLRSSILSVLEHDQVSSELRSFLGELVGTILRNAQETDSRTDEAWEFLVQDLLPLHKRDQPGNSASFPVETPASHLPQTYQIRVAPRLGEILVTNLATGKGITCTAEDLVSWAKLKAGDYDS
jgi:hypothetical protein